MAVPSAPDDTSGVTDHSPASHDPADQPTRSSPAGSIAAVLLGVVILSCLASLGYLFLGYLFLGRDSGDDVAAERESVMSQAEQFMLRLNTYGPELLDASGEMPQYRESVIEVITPKFEASFTKGVTAAEATVNEAGVGRTGKVYATGVSSLDADSAKVLIAGSFTVSYPDPEADPETEEGARVETPEAVFRVEVSLVKTGGEWLVDDFVPVTGIEETPGGVPDPSPLDPTLPLPTSPSTAPTTAPSTGEPTP